MTRLIQTIPGVEKRPQPERTASSTRAIPATCRPSSPTSRPRTARSRAGSSSWSGGDVGALPAVRHRRPHPQGRPLDRRGAARRRPRTSPTSTSLPPLRDARAASGADAQRSPVDTMQLDPSGSRSGDAGPTERAAVDHEHVTGDPAAPRRWRGTPRRRRCRRVRRVAAGAGPAATSSPAGLPQRAGEVGLHEARCDRVHPDTWAPSSTARTLVRWMSAALVML